MNRKSVLEKFKDMGLKAENMLTYFNIDSANEGTRKMVKCPFHIDNTPSAILNLDETFHCFACDVHLDLVQLYASLKMDDLDYGKNVWEDNEGANIVKEIIEIFGLEIRMDSESNDLLDIKSEFVKYLNSGGYNIVYDTLYTETFPMADRPYQQISLPLREIYIYKNPFDGESIALKSRYEVTIAPNISCKVFTKKGGDYQFFSEASKGKPLKRKTFRFFNVVNNKIESMLLPENKKNLIYKGEDVVSLHKKKKKGKNEWIWFVEGEKDVETLNQYGVTACSLMKGSGSKWSKEFNNIFKKCNVIISPDYDGSGQEYCNMLYDALINAKYEEIVEGETKEIECLTGLKIMNEKFYEIMNMPKKSDITDLIEKLKTEGLDKSGIKHYLNDIIERSIDYKNHYTIDDSGKSLYYKKTKIANFQVVNAVNIVSTDSSQADKIKLTIKGLNYPEEKDHTRIAYIHEMFGSPDAFNKTFSVMDCTFLSSKDHLFVLKDFILKYKMFEKNYMYPTNGMYKHFGEWVTVTPEGALRKDGSWDETIFSSNSIMFNDLKGITSELDNIDEVGKAIMNFNVKEIVYNVLGEVGCKLMNARYKELGIKNHLFSMNGTKGAGKTETSVKIMATITLNNTRGEYNLSGQSNFTFLKNVSSNNIGGIILQELKLGKMTEYDRNKWSEIFRNNYDRSRSQRGTKDQQLNEYDHNNPLITTGEEGIGEEAALYERFNIIFMTADKRNSHSKYRENFMFLCDNQKALRVLGRRMLIDIMNLTNEKIMEERCMLEKLIRSEGLDRLGFIDRTLNNIVNVMQGLLRVDQSLKNLGYQKGIDITEGYKFIIDNFIDNVLKIGDDSKANDDYQTMLLQYQKAIDNDYTDKVVGKACNAYTVFENCLWISPQKLRTVIANFTYDSKSDIVVLSEGEFRKNLINSGYISTSESEKKKFNQSDVKGWYYRVNLLKIGKLGLGFLGDLIDSGKIAAPNDFLDNKNEAGISLLHNNILSGRKFLNRTFDEWYETG